MYRGVFWGLQEFKAYLEDTISSLQKTMSIGIWGIGFLKVN